MKIGHSEVYQSYRDLLIHTETMVWRRFTTYLVFTSLLILAWTTLFTAPTSSAWGKLVMTALSVLGMLSGLAWAEVGRRGKASVKGCREEAKILELHPDDDEWWEEEIATRDRPFQAQIRVAAAPPLSGILVWVPLVSVLLHLLLLLATWLGGHAVPWLAV